MANYPVSVYAPSTHNTGDIIQAADVNNPNAEIVAIEQDLVNGALRVNLIPSADVTKSIGSSSFRWQNFYSAALQALDVSSRVNYLVAKAAATAGAPSLQSSGTDATVNLLIGTLGGTQLKLIDVASIVNFIQISGRATGGVPDLAFTGSDATVGGTISTKGGVQIQFDDVASIINNIHIQGKPTGSSPNILFTGSDATVSGTLSTKGGTALKLIDAASLANYAKLIPAAAGTRVQYAVDGSDTNIDLDLVPKGTGSVRVNNGNLLLVDGVNQGRISTGNTNRTRMLQSMARAERTSAQSVPTGTWTAIAFNSASVNTDNIWSSGSPTRVTAQITGKYLAVAGVTAPIIANTEILVSITKNTNGTFSNTAVLVEGSFPVATSTGGGQGISTCTGPILLNANDYLELFVLQNSGSSMNIGAQVSSSDTFLSLLYVGE